MASLNCAGTAVHPHACGENCQAVACTRSHLGSSPRVWGKQRLDYLKVISNRFIPTRVGKTVSPLRRLASNPVHPHACGENVWVWRTHAPGDRFIPTRVGKTQVGLIDLEPSDGSSPRVWGKLWLVNQDATPQRFIPTRVGKTSRAARCWRPGTVHPHACGENAGGMVSRSTAEVHPHACGENAMRLTSWTRGSGSSPRVWGKRRISSFHRLISRFIPTRVGKTTKESFYRLQFAGSSPRVWGKRVPPSGERRRLRFIPTRVGKTDALLSLAREDEGSSPRVWGKRNSTN